MDYLVGEASGLGFSLVPWSQVKIVSEPEKFTPFYQGRSSKFPEGDNLTTKIDECVASGELKDVGLFVLMDNLILDSVFYKGISKIPLLFELVLRLH